MMPRDLLKKKHDREVRAIFGRRFPRNGRLAIAIFATLMVCVVAGTGSSRVSTLGTGDILSARSKLQAQPDSRAQGLIYSFDEQASWLEHHGLAFERRAYNIVAGFVFAGAARVFSQNQNLSLLADSYLALQLAIFRISFLVISSWRLWCVVIIASCLVARLRLRQYEGNDVLGETGNGALFYSGILANLGQVDERGAPTAQVTGLACLQQTGAGTFGRSPFAVILQKYGAWNQTNQELASIVLEYSNIPWFVPIRDEQTIFDATFEGGTLGEAAPLLLGAVLKLHDSFKCNNTPGPIIVEDGSPGGVPLHQKPLSIEHVVSRIGLVLRRVLTTTMQADLAKATSTMVATLTLAHEASKALVHLHEGDRWIRRSNFPQLSARAVLHSLPSFSSDYLSDERTDIRRALIYASRQSAFAPVRMPLDMNARASAMRQWSEVLLACPHQLLAVAEDAELFGIVTELHDNWSNAFFETVSGRDHDFLDGTFVSQSTLLFFPVQTLLTFSRAALPKEGLERLSLLIGRVGKRQTMRSLDLEYRKDGGKASHKNVPPAKVLSPLSFVETMELAKLHNLDCEALKDWSAIRIMLDSFGWLACRVGDHTVPESSLIFLVAEIKADSCDAMEPRRFGKTGMVPLRASKLKERLGRSWDTHCSALGSVAMAETKDHFERLLRGEKDKSDEEFAVSDLPPGTP